MTTRLDPRLGHYSPSRRGFWNRKSRRAPARRVGLDGAGADGIGGCASRAPGRRDAALQVIARSMDFMAAADLFAPDFKATPYWWERTPRPELAEPALPARVDVLVVGSGYTGLNAALQTARGGRSTLVIDAEAAGWGCSTRNGGQVSASVKPSFAELAKAHGEERARGILAGRAPLARLARRVRARRGDRLRLPRERAVPCRAQRTAIRGAGAPRRQSAEGDRARRRTGAALPSRRRRSAPTPITAASSIRRHAALDPARYHRGLLERVIAAGATIAPHCAATSIERQSGGLSRAHVARRRDGARRDRGDQRLYRAGDAVAADGG